LHLVGILFPHNKRNKFLSQSLTGTEEEQPLKQIARRICRFTGSSECDFSDFSASLSVRLSSRRMLLLPISTTVASLYSISEAHSSCGPTQFKVGRGVPNSGAQQKLLMPFPL